MENLTEEKAKDEAIKSGVEGEFSVLGVFQSKYGTGGIYFDVDGRFVSVTMDAKGKILVKGEKIWQNG